MVKNCRMHRCLSPRRAPPASPAAGEMMIVDWGRCRDAQQHFFAGHLRMSTAISRNVHHSARGTQSVRCIYQRFSTYESSSICFIFFNRALLLYLPFCRLLPLYRLLSGGCAPWMHFTRAHPRLRIPADTINSPMQAQLNGRACKGKSIRRGSEPASFFFF